MTHKFIKREIPEAISAEGGAMIVLVDKETVELETSIQEAQDGLYVIGDKLLIKGFFVGLFKSMIAGVQRDGHARQLADFLTVYPVVTGEFDLETGWNPAVNGVKIRVRLMNELTIDITNWEFVDATPGRVPFKLESVKAGDTIGVVNLDNAIEINGKAIPLTADIRVDWYVEGTTKSGTIAGTKVTSSVSRVDIAADALSELKSSTYNGKTIVFTVRGNYANAKISAVLKYVPLAFTSATSEGEATGTVKANSVVTIVGTGMRALVDEDLVLFIGGTKTVSMTSVTVAADKCSMTAHLGEFPSGYEPGPGEVAIVPDDPSKAYPAECEVTVL